MKNIAEFERFVIKIMENINVESWEYDKTSAFAIEAYANQLVGKTFQEIIDDDANSISERGSENKKNKGNLGQILEERYFHYACNND